MHHNTGAGRTRLVIIVVALVAIIGLLALFVAVRAQSNRLVDAASVVELGDTRAEVTRKLGQPDTWYNGGSFSGVCYGDFQSLRHGITAQANRMINRQVSTDLDDWPVHIRFDSTGAVDRIKRGESVVEN